MCGDVWLAAHLKAVHPTVQATRVPGPLALSPSTQGAAHDIVSGATAAAFRCVLTSTRFSTSLVTTCAHSGSSRQQQQQRGDREWARGGWVRQQGCVTNERVWFAHHMRTLSGPGTIFSTTRSL
jgi:hypothetical protein